MRTLFNCEISYFKKLFAGLFIANLLIFLLSQVLPIGTYASGIYFASLLIIVLNIIVTVFKVIVLSLGWKAYDDCADLSIVRRAYGWIGNIL